MTDWNNYMKRSNHVKSIAMLMVLALAVLSLTSCESKINDETTVTTTSETTSMATDETTSGTTSMATVETTAGTTSAAITETTAETTSVATDSTTSITPTYGCPFGNSFYAVDIFGNSVKASDYSGNKITIVNIWAPTCSPCIKEMPYLANLSAKYADEGVAFMGIVINLRTASDSENAKNIATQTGAYIYHHFSMGSVLSLYRKLSPGSTIAVPLTAILDSEGNIIEKYTGMKSEAEWDLIISQVLNSIE